MPRIALVREAVEALTARGESLCFAGVQVHDARLVAAMLVYGILRLLTLNDRDFGRYTAISAVHPRDVVPAVPGQ